MSTDYIQNWFAAQTNPKKPKPIPSVPERAVVVMAVRKISGGPTFRKTLTLTSLGRDMLSLDISSALAKEGLLLWVVLDYGDN